MAQYASPPEELSPFATDPDDDLPVGVQLAWRLRALISTGRLPAGERLPSFRRLAEWAGVNVNTVRSVYAGLEAEGLVSTLQGRGTFVAQGVAASPALEEIATEALRQARQAGLSARELAIVATACASIADEQGPSPVVPAGLPDFAESAEAIEVRHELHRQIGRLEGELATYVRDLPDDMPTAHRFSEARLLTIDDLERTRDTLIAQLSEAQKAAELRARQEGHARAERERSLGSSQPSAGGEGPLARAMSWWQSRS